MFGTIRKLVKDSIVRKTLQGIYLHFAHAHVQSGQGMNDLTDNIQLHSPNIFTNYRQKSFTHLTN